MLAHTETCKLHIHVVNNKEITTGDKQESTSYSTPAANQSSTATTNAEQFLMAAAARSSKRNTDTYRFGGCTT